MNHPRKRTGNSSTYGALWFAMCQAFRHVFQDQSGQVLPMVAMMMVAMLGMCGFVIDVGRLYVSYHQLQASTDAAALAGAQSLPGNGAAAAATAYGSGTGGKNAFSNLASVTMVSGYPLVKCLSTLSTQGMACVAPANGNAIQVKQQATVPMYFAALFGTSSITLTASATASMNGKVAKPYNVAIIIDTTASMATADSNCGGVSRLACALQGVQILLHNLSPCSPSLTTCGTATNGDVANSVDRVALFTFPNVTVGTAVKEYDCSSTNPTIPVYSLPPATGSTYAPSGLTTATYQVIPFQSDYRTSVPITTLNTSSNLTLAVNGKSGCTGLTDPGGDGTYYAGVIYAAQAALTAEAVTNPVPNAIIILSDGDASASSSKMAAKTTDGVTSINSAGTYPSYNGQCNQAVIAAAAAAAAGTRIYSVAYGSAGSGCSTDVSYGPFKGITPCQTMQKIASSPAYFFSDYNQSGSGSTCQSASQPTSNLTQIFTLITKGFTSPHLIPDDTQ
jgi:Flp pilus assembly protein TadG